MIALTRKSILLALEQERLITQRQHLLKQLWRLEKRQRHAEEARSDTNRP